MEWFNLDKKKPKDEDRVLIYQPRFKEIKQCVISVGVYERGVLHPFLSSGYDDSKWWMPLPKPPKPRKKKKAESDESDPRGRFIELGDEWP